MASMLALAVAGLPAISAHADTKTKPKDQPKLCDYYGGSQEDNITFVTPGDVEQIGNTIYVCGKDGEWHFLRTTVGQPGGVTGGTAAGTGQLPVDGGTSFHTGGATGGASYGTAQIP
jgi:hypothetical protein